jgi:hypothetical protein
MDTNDLRIGNYVKVNGEIVIVDGICGSGGDGEYIQTKKLHDQFEEVKISDVASIPLEGELLIKCCEFDKEGHHIIGIDQHRHYLKMEGGYIVLLNKEKSPLIHFWDIKSLHQLQNLYYALKGKEMQVVF